MGGDSGGALVGVSIDDDGLVSTAVLEGRFLQFGCLGGWNIPISSGSSCSYLCSPEG
jgi:hypothetical protein